MLARCRNGCVCIFNRTVMRHCVHYHLWCVSLVCTSGSTLYVCSITGRLFSKISEVVGLRDSRFRRTFSRTSNLDGGCVPFWTTCKSLEPTMRANLPKKKMPSQIYLRIGFVEISLPCRVPATTTLLLLTPCPWEPRTLLAASCAKGLTSGGRPS